MGDKYGINHLSLLGCEYLMVKPYLKNMVSCRFSNQSSWIIIQLDNSQVWAHPKLAFASGTPMNFPFGKSTKNYVNAMYLKARLFNMG